MGGKIWLSLVGTSVLDFRENSHVDGDCGVPGAELARSWSRCHSCERDDGNGARLSGVSFDCIGTNMPVQFQMAPTYMLQCSKIGSRLPLLAQEGFFQRWKRTSTCRMTPELLVACGLSV